MSIQILCFNKATCIPFSKCFKIIYLFSLKNKSNLASNSKMLFWKQIYVYSMQILCVFFYASDINTHTTVFKYLLSECY